MSKIMVQTKRTRFPTAPDLYGLFFEEDVYKRQFNLWTAFPGVEKRQVVKGIPQEIIDRLAEKGGTTGQMCIRDR